MEVNNKEAESEVRQSIPMESQLQWRPIRSKVKCDNCQNGELIAYSVFLNMNLCNRCARLLEKQDKQEHPEKYLKYCGVPELYRTCSLKNFYGNDKLLTAIREYINKRPINNLLLTGKVGCGKTHLAVAILAELVKENIPLSVMYFILFEDLLLDIRRSYDDNRLCDSEESIINRFCEYDLLVIDDIGATQVKDFQIRILYNILEGRLAKNKKIIVTTNLDPAMEIKEGDKVIEVVNEIEQLFGARIGSRMAGFRIIRIKMDDYRKKSNRG